MSATLDKMLATMDRLDEGKKTAQKVKPDFEKTIPHIKQRALTFYREERACYTEFGEVFEDFPTYNVWMEDFWKDFFENRRIVPIEENIAMADAEVEQAEAELASGPTLPAEPVRVPADPINDMVAKAVVRQAKKKSSKKMPLNGKTKSAIGKAIITKLLAKRVKRGDIIKVLMDKADMSLNYAQTFYGNMRKAA